MYAKKCQWLQQLMRGLEQEASSTWKDTQLDDACAFLGWRWAVVSKNWTIQSV